MLIAHKICLDPNNAQATYFARAAGTARFACNWALAEWQRQYDAHKVDPTQPKPSQAALRRQLNAIKRERFPWMFDVTKNAPQMAIIQLGQAFQNFFAGRAKYPKFRKKGVHDRFTLTNDQFSVEDSIAIDTRDDSHLPKAENQGEVGVDLGVKALATLSTGETIPGPKAHKSLLGRLQRLSRSLSRKVKGSSNRRKAKAKLAKLHVRIGNIRADALHKLTTDLTRRFHTIGIEDLNVRGMVKNRHLSRSVSDMGFFEFRRQLEYKAAMRGGVVHVADRFYASSKTCADCGHKLDVLPLAVREWTCPECGTTHDRDMNAAINLKNVAVSSTVSACGEDGSGHGRKLMTKPAFAKQEVSFEPV